MPENLMLRPADFTSRPIPPSLDLPEWAASALDYIRKALDSGETVTVSAVEETLTPAEMAQEIGISRAGIQRRITAGEIATRKRGTRHRIPRSEVERFRSEFISELSAALADDF